MTKQEKIFMKKLEKRISELESENKKLKEKIKDILSDPYEAQVNALQIKLKEAEDGLETGIRLTRELFDGTGPLREYYRNEIDQLIELLKSIRGEQDE